MWRNDTIVSSRAALISSGGDLQKTYLSKVGPITSKGIKREDVCLMEVKIGNDDDDKVRYLSSK